MHLMVSPTRATGNAFAAVSVETFTPAAPTVQPERILRIQGYADVDRVRPAIRRSAAAMAILAGELSAPRVAYRRLPVRAIDIDGLLLDGGVRFHCRAFDRTLAGCTEVVVFVLTIGPHVDAKVVALADTGELLDALLLETAGWLCIEDATRQLKVRLRSEANARDCRITSRLGPGYSYRIDGETRTWPLEEQASLFGLFDGAEIPVSMMESCAMLPKLSRSGLFGVAPDPAWAGQRGLQPMEQIE